MCCSLAEEGEERRAADIDRLDEMWFSISPLCSPLLAFYWQFSECSPKPITRSSSWSRVSLTLITRLCCCCTALTLQWWSFVSSAYSSSAADLLLSLMLTSSLLFHSPQFYERNWRRCVLCVCALLPGLKIMSFFCADKFFFLLNEITWAEGSSCNCQGCKQCRLNLCWACDCKTQEGITFFFFIIVIWFVRNY